MFANRPGSIRRQLVLLYLGVLALLLLALGVFQAITLSDYLRSTASSSLRQAAYAELRVLGPCFIQSRDDLNRLAQTMAGLLGSRDTAVKIVTASGISLADHGFGLPGHSRPLHLSAETIHLLISTLPQGRAGTGHTPATDCETLPSQYRLVRRDRPTLTQGNLVLSSVPLGPLGAPVGYALLGRSFATADNTVHRSDVVFALGALAALVFAALVALPLINRALQPLRRVANTAGAIAAGDLSQRANLAHTTDEIGRLGSAFDTMVDRLESAVNTATQSEEHMRRFLADASHELRTPLTVLRGMSEVLLRQSGQGHPEFVQPLRDLNEEAIRLSRLVDDLLTLTRLDAGQGFASEMVPLRPFLEGFAERYGSAWPHRQIELAVDGLNDASVQADPEALRRIVTNLVDNAARYSTANQPIVLSGTVEHSEVTLSVRDAGPGLSVEDAARAFERFYRGVKSRSRSSGGSGLGLSIVQALAQQSGGTVRIDTGPGQGTTVFVTFPLARDAA